MEYELLFFTSPANESQIDAIKKELTEILESLGAKFTGDFQDIGKRKLAYPIKRDTHAFYSFIRFILEDENRNNIGEINRRISLNDKIIRHIVVRASEIGKPLSQLQTEKTEELVAKTEKKKKVEKKSKSAISELDDKLSEILKETPS